MLFPSEMYLRARELSDAGDHAAAHEVLVEELTQPIAKVLQDGVTRREAVLLDAWCLLWLRRHDECMELLQSACRTGWLDSADGEAALIRMWIDLHRGRYEHVCESTRLYIEKHRQQADWLLAEHLYLHAFAACRLGRLDAAAESYELAIALYRLTCHVPEEIEATNRLGHIQFLMSRYARAEECYRRCCELCMSRNDNRRLVFVLLNMGILRYKVGDFAAARLHLEEAQSYTDATTAPADLCRIKLALGHVQRMRRDFTDARQLLTRAYSEACELQIPREECLALEFLGDVHRDEGRPAEALRYYERGVAIAERIAPQGDLMMELRRREGECLASLEREQEAETAFARSETLCESIGDRYELGVLWRCRALASLSARRLETAREQVEQSVTILEAIGAKYELGLSRHTAAQVWLQLADAPRELVAAAGATQAAECVPDKELTCVERARSHALGAHHLLQRVDVPYWSRQSRKLLEKITDRCKSAIPDIIGSPGNIVGHGNAGDSMIPPLHSMIMAIRA